MTQARLAGGRYELGELIGYGGMAEVHRGRDVRLGRDVAIKVLRADLARDPSFLHRFRREAQSAAGLNHPAIVAVYDTGEDVGAEGVAQPYIVMEFVEGRTLRDILRTEGRLPVRRAMEIAADVAGALDFSHRGGLIHRDVKPANVMITPSGAVKVMDFGIARAVADNAATVTQTANVIGTAQYLSPEQARGQAVDPRSDVYSLGCLLYELVTGAPPFQGDSPVAVAYQHVRENPVPPSVRVPDLPRSIDSIVMKALAKNPHNRYQTAGEMRGDLLRALADQPVVAEAVMTDAERTQFIARPPAGPPPLIPGPPRSTRYGPASDEEEPDHRSGWIWAAIVLALLLVIGGAAFLIYRLGSGTSGRAQVAVPSVIGDPVPAAQKAMRKANLLFQPYRTSDGQLSATTGGPCDDGSTPRTEGVVCKLLDGRGRTVSANQDVAPRSTIFYQTYKQSSVNVPYVLGMSYNDAQNAMKNAGLTNVKRGSEVNTEKFDAGKVAKTDPGPDTVVKPNQLIVLHLSSGKVVLPDVTKLADDAAKKKLDNAGFTNIDDSQTRTTRKKRKDGTVFSESPNPGIAYKPHQQVTLVIWHYVPLPVCTTTVVTPTPTPTVITYTPSPTTGPTVGPGQGQGQGQGRGQGQGQGPPTTPPGLVSTTPSPTTPSPTTTTSTPPAHPSTTVTCTTPPG